MSYVPSSFTPRFTGGHWQTLYAWAKPRAFPRLPAPEERFFDPAPEARVLAPLPLARRSPGTSNASSCCTASKAPAPCTTCAGMADKAWTAGWNVVRLNQRNCGGTEHLSRGLYHSGLTHDPLFVLRELLERDGLPSVAIAGYSLGGNLALRLAGELGEAAPPQLRAICAVSPTMDLSVCVTALERRANYPYQWNFVRNLKARMRRKAAAFPADFSVEPLGRIWTIRQFDEAYTAPHHGFRDATDYYHRASAMRVLDRIAVPTLILTASNDPFVPPGPFTDPVVRDNPHITAVVTPEGGHCAFLERGPESGPEAYDGYWAEREVIRFVETHRGAP